MIGTSIMKVVGPRWLLLGSGVLLLGVLSACTVLMVAFTGANSAVATDLNYQCDSAVGPDPAVTVTATTATTAAPSGGTVSIPPTANPYASLPDSGDSSPWMRACRGALHSAPYQLPPLRTAAAGLATECARNTAVALVDQGVSSGSGSEAAVDAAAVLSLVARWQSAAVLSGVCPAVQAADFSAERGSMAARAVPAARGCPRPTVAAAIELPGTIAAQSLCGQRVDPAAVSPGDLVFWRYDGYVPARGGVAVGGGQLVAEDPVTAQVVLMSMPNGRDVRVKRLLSGPS